jgi:4-amino-4-deoxy-L-arabinose transferase-like glycosyltransferase
LPNLRIEKLVMPLKIVQNLAQYEPIQWYKWLTIIGILLYIPGLWIDVMEIDAAQYAAMSLEMFQTGNYLQVYEQGRDYLDKPPLLFWLSSTFIGWLGNAPWVYKLPSLLFSILGIYSVWRIADLYGDQERAWLSAMILTLSQGMFIMNNDVRTDNLLTGAVAFTYWMLSEIDVRKKVPWRYFVGVGIGIGLAMLSKGPLGLVLPALGFGFYWMRRQDWRKIFHPGWAISVIISALLLLPMMIGLYEQFDAHPDKMIHGRQGVSGLRFFFWEQSFGRITGESSWKNDSGPLFFVHTYIWAFFPWVIMLIPALLYWARRSSHTGAALGWAWVLTFAALSSSRFKLPHYIYVTLPFAAILVAQWWQTQSRIPAWLKIVSYIPPVLTLLLIAVLSYAVFPMPWIWLFALVAFVLSVIFFGNQMSQGKQVRVIILLGFAALLFNGFLSIYFYPNLLQYQGGTQATQYYLKNKGDDDQLYISGQRRSCAQFHHGSVLPAYNIENEPKNGYIWVMVNGADMPLPGFDESKAELVASYPDFPVSLLNMRFLNHQTRHEVLDSTFLYKVIR